MSLLPFIMSSADDSPRENVQVTLCNNNTRTQRDVSHFFKHLIMEQLFLTSFFLFFIILMIHMWCFSGPVSCIKGTKPPLTSYSTYSCAVYRYATAYKYSVKQNKSYVSNWASCWNIFSISCSIPPVQKDCILHLVVECCQSPIASAVSPSVYCI